MADQPSPKHEAAFTEDKLTRNSVEKLDEYAAPTITLQQLLQSFQALAIDERVALVKEKIDRIPKDDPIPAVTLDLLGAAGLSWFQQSGEQEHLHVAISYLHEALILRPTPHVERAMALTNLASGVLTRFEHLGRHEDLDNGIILLQEALLLRPAPHAGRVGSLNNLANALQARFEQCGQLQDLDEVIILYQEALLLCTSLDLGRCHNTLESLAGALLSRFEQLGERKDLDDEIFLRREALLLCPPPHLDRSASLDSLASSLLSRSQQFGGEDDREEAILLYKEALSLRPSPHPGRSITLNNLANGILMRFNQLGDPEDLAEAILLYRESLLLRPAPHPNRSSSLNNLANALVARFRQSREREYLDEGIVLLREALTLCSTSHPNRSEVLNSLASALHARLQQLGMCEDLDESILFHREALALRPPPHPNRFDTLNSLASALHARFQQSGVCEDLDESILLLREALALRSPLHPNRMDALNSLASALHTRFQQSGVCEDLDERILLRREALALCPLPHPNRSDALNSLANALHTRFQKLGIHEDLDEVIILLRETLSLCPPSYTNRSSLLDRLAAAITERFMHLCWSEDLEEVILLHRESLSLRPPPHPDRHISLIQLANAITTRFQLLEGREDLDEAILLHRQGLLLLPSPHPSRSTSLIWLAQALIIKFKKSGEYECLEEAILLLRETIPLRPRAHPGRASLLYNLAYSILTRFKQSGQREDLDEAVLLSREAVDTVDSEHREHCRYSSFMGEVLLITYSLDTEVGYLNGAMDAFRAASNSTLSHLPVRLRATRQWAQHAQLNNHSSAMEAYEHAIALLHRLTSLGHDLHKRQKILVDPDIDGLARSAAIYAISIGRFEKALEFLEAGRAIFWLQALQLRSPVDKLRQLPPELEEKFSNLSNELERGSHLHLDAYGLAAEHKQEVEKELLYFSQLNNLWVKTLEEIRKLDGFKDFLKPNTLSTLQLAARDGPIVILIADHSASHALIMTSDDVRHIDLPGIKQASARDLISKIRGMVPKGRRTDGSVVSTSDILKDTGELADRQAHNTRYGRPAAVDREDTFRDILKFLWLSVVQPIVRALKLEKSKHLPIIRWCPTGAFSFLPLHAAGLYRLDMSSIDSASDYLVSAYTPTIGVLLLNRRSLSSNTNFEMLVVIESTTLHNTNEELNKIEKYVSHAHLVKIGLPGTPASTDEVLSHLSNASIVHFACHGEQYNHSPLESALILNNGRLKISRIMKERMPNAELAFLCACETAMGDENLPDESMHLGATLLFSGFCAVIATMWAIDDQDGPTVADTFYQHLFRGGSSKLPDIAEAARALHVATVKLRSQGASFKRWVPFIYLGS